ncbi:non-symbiotic hemoglobin 2-like isoform X2 [Phalaenopsis equestris]|uniref:non-symbiotic hemoglobin 2-like isoform X2 n=1 Tax=Phalaenopsis equestris TaxID=78828 RepID=UPI0009E2B1DE|nr:non-symbiotic hemoglobin 2-like isoform X2 [Phalaenopsis equestris]
MDLCEKQKTLVMHSWELMRPNLGNLSVRFFTEVLDNIPEARDMFYFLKDYKDSPHNNQKLKTHALVVFKLTCNSAVRFQEKGDIALSEDALKKLGSIHLKKNVMKGALLKIVHEGVGEQWSDELGKAWGVAYDRLAEAIKIKMNE